MSFIMILLSISVVDYSSLPFFRQAGTAQWNHQKKFGPYLVLILFNHRIEKITDQYNNVFRKPRKIGLYRKSVRSEKISFASSSPTICIIKAVMPRGIERYCCFYHLQCADLNRANKRHLWLLFGWQAPTICTMSKITCLRLSA